MARWESSISQPPFGEMHDHSAAAPGSAYFQRPGSRQGTLVVPAWRATLLRKLGNVLFIHYEIEPAELQRCIPYPLDLYHGRAFVSLVAFTMCGMRPWLGGTLGALLFKPIATHHFLNVRTYVRHQGEAAIYFMREWLSNQIAAWLGPWSFGLPYQFGKIEYRNDFEHECPLVKIPSGEG